MKRPESTPLYNKKHARKRTHTSTSSTLTIFFFCQTTMAETATLSTTSRLESPCAYMYAPPQRSTFKLDTATQRTCHQSRSYYTTVVVIHETALPKKSIGSFLCFRDGAMEGGGPDLLLGHLHHDPWHSALQAASRTSSVLNLGYTTGGKGGRTTARIFFGRGILSSGDGKGPDGEADFVAGTTTRVGGGGGGEVKYMNMVTLSAIHHETDILTYLSTPRHRPFPCDERDCLSMPPFFLTLPFSIS